MKLLNPQERALTGAKLRAWWEGEAFDAEAFLAAQEAAPETANDPDLTPDLFDAPRDYRLDALQRLWGEGRIAPPMAGEGEAYAALGLSAAAEVALLGPGLYADVAPVLSAKAVKLLEWRSETMAALAAASADKANVSVEALDLDVTTLPAEAFDALVSFDEFSYAANPMRLALQIARTLKPGAKALIEIYVGGPDPDFDAAFASAFAEPQIHQHNVIAHALTEAGLDIEADEDVSAVHVAAARAAFHAFSEKAATMGAMPPREAQELHWETQTWRTRLTLLIHARLQRRKFLVHRRV
ncbi:MAG TPA: class I SAM-dependent methyltransferase [Caulobacterales bacterium]|nr:class I SAM-dependent methyltransferase [Caulobacterales bacterium]